VYHQHTKQRATEFKIQTNKAIKYVAITEEKESSLVSENGHTKLQEPGSFCLLLEIAM